jgi:hypothetical protein
VRGLLPPAPTLSECFMLAVRGFPFCFEQFTKSFRRFVVALSLRRRAQRLPLCPVSRLRA